MRHLTPHVEFVWIMGLLLWLVPWPKEAARLSEVGKWVFLIGFAVWLGLFHGGTP